MCRSRYRARGSRRQRTKAASSTSSSARNRRSSRACEAPRAEGLACGQCPGCRYVVAGQHPDLRIVEPVDIDDDGTATPVPWITVGHVRGLIEWAQLTSHRRMAKIAVIAPAELMNAA